MSSGIMVQSLRELPMQFQNWLYQIRRLICMQVCKKMSESAFGGMRDEENSDVL